MEIAEAIRIIRSLANGTDPETEEPLGEDSVCRAPAAVKALNRALAALVAQEGRGRNKPTNAGRPWTGAEDEQMCEALRRGTDFNEIAKAHNRTIAAILARLVKLGKIKPQKSGDLFPPKVA